MRLLPKCSAAMQIKAKLGDLIEKEGGLETGEVILDTFDMFDLIDVMEQWMSGSGLIVSSQLSSSVPLLPCVSSPQSFDNMFTVNTQSNISNIF